MNAGDFDLVVSPDDGKAYYYFERVHSELICADLTSDYTDVTGYYSSHFQHPGPPAVREAPAYFYRGHRHYLITSGTSGYYPNPSEVASALTYHGPWTVLGDPHVDDPSGLSFNSQISSVFKHPYKKDLYIALADRWMAGLTPEEMENNHKVSMIMAWKYGSENVPRPDLADEDIREIPVNTSLASYVWLPLRFDGDMVFIDWMDQWRIEDYE